MLRDAQPIARPPHRAFAQSHRPESQSQVAARRRLQRLSGADVALEEDVNAPVAGLCGDSVDAHAGQSALVA